MDMSVIQINADSFIPTEQHFKVSAGPGAGKTRWLVNHIRNVLHQSKRLSKTRKIVCITYTNVAAEIILERLGTNIEHVEVSTIHSFLYKHVVKPYAVFIAEEYSLNVAKMDRHDDFVFSSYSFINELKSRTQQQRIGASYNGVIVEAIKAARWKFDNQGNLIIRPDYPRKINGYAIKNETYFEYKKMSWERGVVHHEDVLFFSYQLVLKFPFILQILRAKFPYFFVDEFQDTNPIQAKILEHIGQAETVVGIIGDRAQSIYSFQGADPLQLSLFDLGSMSEYQILENYRSTNEIIDFLNLIRSDLQQTKPSQNEQGEKPKLIVGEMGESLRKVKELCYGEKVCSLSRDNITSNVLKKEANIDCPDNDLLQELFDIDSNSDRRKVVLSCIKATEFAVEKRYKEAIKELSKALGGKGDYNAENRREVLSRLNFILGEYDEIQKMSLMDFYAFVKKEIKDSIAGLSKGKIKNFYEQHTYKQLAVCVKITEDNSFNRTAHKAKGDEFDNVLLVLRKVSDLAFIFAPDLDSNEEHRINYVAVSRARKRLFISVPSLVGLSDSNKDKLFGLLSVIETADGE
jgi:DNA helicase II / ATP-dependent DNA helicase PcrA